MSRKYLGKLFIIAITMGILTAYGNGSSINTAAGVPATHESSGDAVPSDPESVIEPGGAGEETTFTATWQSEDYGLRFTVPDTWEEYDNPEPFDLRFVNREIGYTGIFIYQDSELPEGYSPSTLLDYHIEDLLSKRDNASTVEERTAEEFPDKKITHAAYIAYLRDKIPPQKSLYYISLVEFPKSDLIAVVMQTCATRQFENVRDELDGIVRSAQLMDSEE